MWECVLREVCCEVSIHRTDAVADFARQQMKRIHTSAMAAAQFCEVSTRAKSMPRSADVPRPSSGTSSFALNLPVVFCRVQPTDCQLSLRVATNRHGGLEIRTSRAASPSSSRFVLHTQTKQT